MKIEIIVKGGEEIIARADCYDFKEAEGELARLERYVKRQEAHEPITEEDSF